MKRFTTASIVSGLGLLMHVKRAAAGPDDPLFRNREQRAARRDHCGPVDRDLDDVPKNEKQERLRRSLWNQLPAGAAQPAPGSGPKAKLIDMSGVTDRKAFDLDKLLNEIGRDPINDISIPKETISSLHAGIEYKDGHYYLIDQKSSNGSFLNGKKITPNKPFRLQDGDRIKFDVYEFTFLLPQQRPAAAGQTVIKLKDESRQHESPRPAESPAKAPQPEAESPPQAAPSPQADASSPAEKDLASAAPGTATRIKSVMCPNHSSRKATELCSICKNAYCLQCMSIEHQKTVCLACAAKMRK